jgi:hypothetical protein
LAVGWNGLLGLSIASSVVGEQAGLHGGKAAPGEGDADGGEAGEGKDVPRAFREERALPSKVRGPVDLAR